MATTSQQQTSIKLISECFVRPKHEIVAEKQFYHLGPVDVVFLTIDPIQKGLLYKFSTNSDASFENLVVIHPNSCVNVVSHLLGKLKHSLSIALVHFYPLAGRLATQIYPDENACSVVVDCNKGPGVRFIHATTLDLTVSDVLSPIDVTIAHPLFDLGEKYVNYDCHTKALLSIQVTQLHDGVFIGFSMSHSVVDGTSFIHFINMLSEIYRSDDCTSESDTITQVSSVPFLNFRPWLSYNFTKEYVPAIKLPFIDVEKFICREYEPEPLRERIFHFSPNSMASLKVRANEESRTTHNNVISSFQALTALVWRSITKARSLPFDHQTTCFLVVGARGRFDPPVSDNYFGNLISRVQWTCKVEELLSNNDLGWVAKSLQNLIRTKDDKSILEQYKEIVDSPMLVPRNCEPYHGMNSVIMGGATRFNMYGPEFGFGRALAARMGYGNKEDGKITASPGCEGNGSVDLEICLKPHIMAALENDEEFMNFVTLS